MKTGSDARGLYVSGLGSNMSRVATAEFIGTFFLMLSGTAAATAAATSRSIAGAPADSLAVALAVGLVGVGLVNTLGHMSGAHFNPAFTLSLAATGKFPWSFFPAYLAAELAGAVAAAGAVWALDGDAERSRAIRAVRAGLTRLQPTSALTPAGPLSAVGRPSRVHARAVAQAR